MKISTKQIRTSSLLIEQVFADEVHIGLMTRPINQPTAPVRAYYVENGNKLDIGIFSGGNIARGNAKTAIIDRYRRTKN